ncbi:MAG: carbamoyltransferase [Verrucomicrobiota bacterium]|nr:carbamoyltransferase [Verrucomicrobiota bacterium]
MPNDATRILGLSALYHDSAAALLVGGEIVAAAQEERFTRIKHDAAMPARAVAYCLHEAGITAADLDYVVFYEKPLQKFDRLFETYLAVAPSGLKSFLQSMPVWLKQKLHHPRELRKLMGPGWKKPFVFAGHHESHAASAFFPSPFDEAAILTVDGVGEWETATLGVGRENQLELLKSLHFPHSLGLLYSAFTYFCGFKINSGEYKLMGLAPYGVPRYADLIREKLIDIKPDGSLRLNQTYFNYRQGLTMTSPAFDKLFGGTARKPEHLLTQREMDLAASIQEITEEVMLKMARHLREITGLTKLCLAGGVALNCVANGKILREGIFDQLWIQPASGDAGGALGAALLIHYQLLENKRVPSPADSMHGAYLGPAFTEDAIRKELEKQDVPHEFCADEGELLAKTARLIAAGQVVGWFQGRMEFGPRALGARSILGDPRALDMQAKLNLRIKFRESFRPFAPSVLKEYAKDYFDLAADSPYMLLVAPVKESIRVQTTEDRSTDPDLRKRVNQVRSTVPAVTHVDYSARVQTVDERHGRYHGLLKAYHAETGCAVLVNTSFNIRGEPIVCTPAEALRCFLATDMDALVMGSFILHKSAMPESLRSFREAYLQTIQPD